MAEGQVSNEVNPCKEYLHSGPEDIDSQPKISSRVVGSKISEKIKAMQSGILDGGMPDSDDTCDLSPASEQPIKLNVSVKALAKTLNINPLTLRVGAKPPKFRELNAVVADLDKEENDVPMPTNPDANQNSAQCRDEGNDHFIETIKTRAKIQSKRRPPSNRTWRTQPYPCKENKTELDSEESNAAILDPLLGADFEEKSENEENLEPEEEIQPAYVLDDLEESMICAEVETAATLEEAAKKENLPEPCEIADELTDFDDSAFLFAPQNFGVFAVVASVIFVLIIAILLQLYKTK